MAVAVVLGALSGIVGFLPLLFGLRMARKATSTSNLGHMGALLLGVLLSFVILFAAAFACIIAVRDLALPFALAEVLALIVVAIAYGVIKLVRK